MLEGKRVVLGVAGGIAAYKAIDVCRRLVDAGAHVIPVLTEGALHFVGRTTFDALGSERAWTSLWDETHPIPHTHLGQTADLVIVAPATARVLGLYATGISDDLLTNILLATRAPVLVCPAMHTEMWEHPAVQDNLRVLRSRGVHVVEPEVGRLAGGDVGAGRLAEPGTIVDAATAILDGSPVAADLTGLRVIVTAGGTREPIDPVRFIGNRSSGKQGHAVAEEAAARGAKVTLVTTVGLPVSARDRRDPRRHRRRRWSRPCSAAPRARTSSSWPPPSPTSGPCRRPPSKIKKSGGLPKVELEPTADILAELGAQPATGPGARRLRRRDRRPAGQRGREAAAQGHRPHRGQRRLRAGRGLRARHERGGDPRGGRVVPRGPPRRQAGHRPLHPRRNLEHKEQLVTRQWTFTSESVTEGHPDKMADQISDSILDAILAEDPMARVACETMVTTGLAVVAGEITTNAYVEIPKIVRDTINCHRLRQRAALASTGTPAASSRRSTRSRPTSPRASTPRSRPAPAPPVRTSSTPRAPATRG